MDPLTLIATGLSLAKTLTSLAVDAGPLLAGIRASIDGLLGKGHITEAQAADLHAQTAALESEWQATLAAARTEP